MKMKKMHLRQLNLKNFKKLNLTFLNFLSNCHKWNLHPFIYYNFILFIVDAISKYAYKIYTFCLNNLFVKTFKLSIQLLIILSYDLTRE